MADQVWKSRADVKTDLDLEFLIFLPLDLEE